MAVRGSLSPSLLVSVVLVASLASSANSQTGTDIVNGLVSSLKSKGYTSLVDAIVAAGIGNELAAAVPTLANGLTLMAPVNSAFTPAIAAAAKDKALLATILKFHLIPYYLSTAGYINAVNGSVLPTLVPGKFQQKFIFKKRKSFLFFFKYNVDVPFIGPKGATNGGPLASVIHPAAIVDKSKMIIVHGIDKVLIPI